MIGVILASGFCVTLVLARIVWTRNVHYAFLIWNLFLAWLPLIFALLARDMYQNGVERRWRFAGLGAAWLLFFPNAPYIFTDLIHLTRGFYRHFWVDLALILPCALTGLVLGFLSLFLMQSIVKGVLGRWLGWLFIAGVAGLSGFGICLGRFLRLNSWDVVVSPFKLYQGVGKWITEPLANSTLLAFGVLYGGFLFIAYVMLYGLTHLQLERETVDTRVSANRAIAKEPDLTA
jgi:uncharacterized membrane protein